MFVHVDVKERRRSVGWAADLCPICRDLRSFEVSEVRRVARVYLVPIGTGTLEGREITCADCKSVLAFPPEEYSAISKRRRDPAKLVELTNPALLDRMDAWFDRQERIAQSILSRRERVAEIVSVLSALEHMAWLRSRGGPEEFAMGICIVFFLLTLIVTLTTWTTVGFVLQVVLLTSLLTSLSIGLILMLTHRPMSVSRHLVPRIVRALEPLEPTFDELGDALALARRNGLRVGRYVNPRRLGRELARDRRRPVVLASPELGRGFT